MLPTSGLAMDLVPLQPDHIDQQALGQAVFAHHLLGQRAPVVGQGQTPTLPET